VRGSQARRSRSATADRLFDFSAQVKFNALNSLRPSMRTGDANEWACASNACFYKGFSAICVDSSAMDL
jgi:hypothetical protein